MTTLYQIQDRYRAICQAIMDAEGELTPELEAAIAIDEAEFAAKAEAYAALIREAEASAEACAAEERRLAALRRSHEALAARLEAALLAAVIERGGKVDVGTFRLSTRRSTAVVVECPPESLPEQYRRVTTTADKAALKAALKAGVRVDGVRLDERTSLVIR